MRYLIKALPLLALCALTFSACKKDSDDDNPPADRNTGLYDTDDESKIPKNLNTNRFLTSPGSLPARADLTKFLPPVGSQGKYGTCVAWAVGYNFKTAIEAIKFNLTTAQLGSPSYQISPLDLFTAIDDSKKGASDCNGSNFTAALDQVLARGVATMAVAPYSEITGQCPRSGLKATWNTDAAKHKIERYRNVTVTTDVTPIKQEIANNTPVIFGAKLADNFMTWNSDAVISSNTTYDNVGQHSYHALCIVGYDDTKGTGGAFRVVNSWDATWGDNGFIWIDYEFMRTQFAMKDCFFVATNDQQKPEPGPGPTPTPTGGTDLMPWVYSDQNISEPGAPRYRRMEYDIFNLGSQAAAPTQAWTYAYVYYDAYDATKYGIAFADIVTNQVTPSTTFQCDAATGLCYLNSTAAANGGSIAAGLNSAYFFRQYNMPVVSGDLYLVLVADIENKFNEQDKDNNLFYTTYQYPVRFVNGVAARVGNPMVNFKNTLSSADVGLPASLKFTTAVNDENRNAYSPREIIGMLDVHAKNGTLKRKINQYLAEKKAADNEALGLVRN